MDTAHVDDDHLSRHEAYLTEAARLITLRERVQRHYGPAPATRTLAPVGHFVRPDWADADARRSVAMPPAPTTRQPLPPLRPEMALDRRWDRLRAALRLRIGEGVMPG